MINAPADRASQVKILAVDDNPAALYATARVLRSAGYEVLEATTGAAALAIAAKADLVVLDINLPDMDGFEVCRQLRARPDSSQMPVLHLSATFTHASDFELGLEAGADSYLTRPVEAKVLLATVRTLLFARHADLIRRGLDAKLRSIYKLAPVAIAMTDSALTIESANPAFCALTGIAAGQINGLPVSEVFGAHMHLFETGHAGSKDGTEGEELVLRRQDGSTSQVELRVAAESVSGARIIVMTDVSYRGAVEQERNNLLASERAARAEAERSNRMKEEFLATISHELRNPLNAILGWSTVLGRSEGLAPDVKRAVVAIERNSRIQAQMIADLLDYAGITFGKMRLQGSSVDPLNMVRGAVDILNETARARRIEIRTQLGDEGMIVEADPARLQQVAVNLLSNAVKFSRDGGLVEVIAARAGSDFRLTVRDHGKGIAPAFLPRLFERFSQQDSTSTKNYGGLGLGLAIVKQLVDLHGGTIAAQSDGEGQGATFTVTLPLSEKSLSDLAEDTNSLPSMDLSGVIALVVEDDHDARELINRLLSDAGATVIEAETAASALTRIQGTNANFLISDIGMADVDGYELMRSLRSQGFDENTLPAIALTAFARSQDRADALAAGFQDHLVKPLDAPTLISRVASLRRAAARQRRS